MMSLKWNLLKMMRNEWSMSGANSKWTEIMSATADSADSETRETIQEIQKPFYILTYYSEN